MRLRCNVGVEVSQGCHLSDHTIALRSVDEREIYNILMVNRKLICQPQTRKKYFFLNKQFPLLKDLVSVQCPACLRNITVKQETVSGSESEVDAEVERANTKHQEKWDILTSNSPGLVKPGSDQFVIVGIIDD